ncbi:BET1-like protein [Dermatophagoides pteronyssinus]|uniref:BET1-like protein n=1 Tax=Dermatophagoides pteronyssinus TaxID=6956 RepID=A0A6P6XKR0_DERPT|nr:BET1-like protein [Dermatophagoides pteronyssinus]
MNDKARDLLDYENRERVENLSQKVSLLKNYAVDIENETRHHNRLLDDVDDDVGSNYVFLKNTSNRLNRLMRTNKNSRLTCYLAIGICFILFLIYFLLSSRMQ